MVHAHSERGGKKRFLLGKKKKREKGKPQARLSWDLERKETVVIASGGKEGEHSQVLSFPCGRRKGRGEKGDAYALHHVLGDWVYFQRGGKKKKEGILIL